MNWNRSFQPLFKQYGMRKHPLEYHSTYELLVMVVLSAQTTDAMINTIAPKLFSAFPSFKRMAAAAPEDLYPFIKSVRGFRKKADWLIRIAQTLAEKKKVPLVLDELIQLPGIGRKSALVIIREAGGPPQGIFMDLHCIRVVSRIGITTGEKPEKMERVLMEHIPQEQWNQAGMSFSYLGRELCRPTAPACPQCPIRNVCAYSRDNR